MARCNRRHGPFQLLAGSNDNVPDLVWRQTLGTWRHGAVYVVDWFISVGTACEQQPKNDRKYRCQPRHQRCPIDFLLDMQTATWPVNPAIARTTRRSRGRRPGTNVAWDDARTHEPQLGKIGGQALPALSCRRVGLRWLATNGTKPKRSDAVPR